MRKLSKTVASRQKQEKLVLLEQFKRTPIVQIACEKTGVSRATYYRWRKEDKAFATNADEAISEGEFLVNDLAESQLLAAIRDQNMTAIIFWLRNHHFKYGDKLAVTARLEAPELTSEQEALIRKALQLTFGLGGAEVRPQEGEPNESANP